MEKYLALSYALALILIVVCILIFSTTLHKRDKLGKLLISVFGIYPGFLGVLWSVSLLFRGGESSRVFGSLSAWLLLEVGAGQLSHLMKNLNKTEKIAHGGSLKGE